MDYRFGVRLVDERTVHVETTLSTGRGILIIFTEEEAPRRGIRVHVGYRGHGTTDAERQEAQTLADQLYGEQASEPWRQCVGRKRAGRRSDVLFFAPETEEA